MDMVYVYHEHATSGENFPYYGARALRLNEWTKLEVQRNNPLKQEDPKLK